MEPAAGMLSCWGAVLGAAVSVPLLLLAAAPYVRCGALGGRPGGLRADAFGPLRAALFWGEEKHKGLFISAAPAALCE